MRARGLFGIAMAASAAAVIAAAAPRQDQKPQQGAPVYRSTNQTVSIYATVVDEDGKLVPNLTRDDFEVTDNGRPQTLTLFDNSVQKISIVIMLDMSGSMTGNIPTLRQAAVQMFTRLLPDDKARIGNFGDRITVSPTFTNDVDDLIRALYLDLQPGGATPLWGAVNVAMTALAHVDGRRVVLVMTDGKDTRGRPSLADVINRSEVESYMIYGIGMASSEGFGGAGGARNRFGGGGYGGRGGGGRSSGDQPDPGLRTLAEDSGGGYLELRRADQLGPAFARVADELHHQYLIGYAVPEFDGKMHQIDVRVRKPGMTSRARKSYLAPKAPGG
jgi:Ca-activated chloride channel family protein